MIQAPFLDFLINIPLLFQNNDNFRIKSLMKKKQENIFIDQEADAWFERNSTKVTKPVSINDMVIEGILSINLPKSGSFIDLGGGVGAVSARITKLYPKWSGTVLEPSKKAIKHGSKIFPWINFISGSISKKKDMPKKVYDMAIISMVFTWIDRNLLTQAVANIDNLVRPGGYIIIKDFYTPNPKVNNYHHAEGVLTYKQDYPLLFTSTNLYTELLKVKKKIKTHTSFDETDIYDQWMMTSILQKDMLGRYKNFTKEKNKFKI